VKDCLTGAITGARTSRARRATHLPVCAAQGFLARLDRSIGCILAGTRRRVYLSSVPALDGGHATSRRNGGGSGPDAGAGLEPPPLSPIPARSSRRSRAATLFGETPLREETAMAMAMTMQEYLKDNIYGQAQADGSSAMTPRAAMWRQRA